MRKFDHLCSKNGCAEMEAGNQLGNSLIGIIFIHLKVKDINKLRVLLARPDFHL